MKEVKIEIIIDSSGKVGYRTPLAPAATVFYLECVKADLVARYLQGDKPEEKKIIVPQLVPPTKLEG